MARAKVDVPLIAGPQAEQLAAPCRVPYAGIGSIIGEEEVAEVREALHQSDLCSGYYVGRFERAFADYVGAEHAVAVSNCTSALELATAALGLKEDDEVITTPLTFIATTLPLLKRKVRVVFADIDPATYNIDPTEIARLVTSRTKAIYVVHYAGLPADMAPILEIARRHGLKVVEDAAHAPGAIYKGRKVGSIGDITCFSFQSLKNMTTLGDGGMVTCNDPLLAERVRLLKAFGIKHLADRPAKYGHREKSPPFYWDVVRVGDEVGLNYRMSEPEAAVGIVQLGRLDAMNARRIEIGRALTRSFRGVRGLTPPLEPTGCTHVYHLYTLLVDERVVGSKDAFMERLEQVEGVEAWTQYCPTYLHGIYQSMGYGTGLCPRAEQIFLRSLISLPIYPALSDSQVEHMSAAVVRTVDALKSRTQAA